MFDRGRSGQYLYFSLVSAISGNIVTGASGAISGRRSLDGGALSLLSGFVTELSSGQGQYVANLFAEDVTGNCIGFLFTAARNWTGLPLPAGMPLALLAGLWLAARVGMFFAYGPGRPWPTLCSC